MSAQLKKMLGKSKELLKNTDGQGLVEYALILVLIAIVVLAAVRGVGTKTSTVFSRIGSEITPKN